MTNDNERKGTATYSPDDNKLRFYADARLSPEDYARAKALGFRWAPKQELFVAPAWTPEREDLLLEWCGEIGDEDRGLVERAEERSERFEDYAGKRMQDAERARAGVAAIADNIPFGQPILVGHHSERHARRDAQKIENGMRKAVRMWETSAYWEQRAESAIRHAKYKELPSVRARRIKTLEAELRKVERSAEPPKLILWDYIKRDAGGEPIKNAAGKVVIDGERALAAQRERKAKPRILSPRAQRWADHLKNRLAYECAMLKDAGGLETDRVKPEVGGAVRCWVSRGWLRIEKVNMVSVSVLDTYNGHRFFKRTVPFDKLREIISRAEYEARGGKAADAARAERIAYQQEKEAFEKEHAAALDKIFNRRYDHLAQSDQDRARVKVALDLAEAKESKAAPAVALQSPPPKPPPEPIPEPIEFDSERRPIVSALLAASESFADLQHDTPKPIDFAAMRESLRQGVKVAAVPQLFPTPPAIVARMLEVADIRDGERVLEPSAGTAAIAAAIPHRGRLLCVEINSTLADGLRAHGYTVEQADFLSLTTPDHPDGLEGPGRFDKILMNPPFQGGADIKHIEHARRFLAAGGRLVAICADGPRQQKTLKPHARQWHALGEGVFPGTNVRSALCVFER